MSDADNSLLPLIPSNFAQETDLLALLVEQKVVMHPDTLALMLIEIQQRRDPPKLTDSYSLTLFGLLAALVYPIISADFKNVGPFSADTLEAFTMLAGIGVLVLLVKQVVAIIESSKVPIVTASQIVQRHIDKIESQRLMQQQQKIAGLTTSTQAPDFQMQAPGPTVSQPNPDIQDSPSAQGE